MNEALQNNILVAGCAGVVDTPQSIGFARGRRGVGREIGRILSDGV